MSGLVQIGGRRNLEHEEERRSLLFFERFIRSSGVLLGMLGLAFVLSVAGALIDGFSEVDPLSALTLTLLGLATGAVGIGMFRLDTRVRWPAMILAVLGLAALCAFFFIPAPHPVRAMSAGGATFHALLLFVLLRGRRVLSPEYQDVLGTTRDLKPGPSLVVWAIVALTVAAAVAV